MKNSDIYRSNNDFWKNSYIGQYSTSYIGQYTTILILTDICLHISAEYMYSYIVRYKTKHISFGIIPN